MTFEELMKDGAFTAQIDAAENMETVAGLFNKNGFNVSVEEIEAVMNEDKTEELDENSLENVAGGGLVTAYLIWKYIKSKRSGFSGSGGGHRF